MKKFLKTITGAVLAVALCASCAPKQEETAAEPTGKSYNNCFTAYRRAVCRNKHRRTGKSRY